jgi:hypothetical protein
MLATTTDDYHGSRLGAETNLALAGPSSSFILYHHHRSQPHPPSCGTAQALNTHTTIYTQPYTHHHDALHTARTRGACDTAGPSPPHVLVVE